MRCLLSGLLFSFLTAGHAENDELESGLVHPLLLSSENKQSEDEVQDYDSEEASEDSRKPATSITSAYRLLTPSIKVWSFIQSIFR